MDDQRSNIKYKWGSGGAYSDGWGPGFREGDDSDDYNQNEDEIKLQKERILEAFETLGLNPNHELTKNQLKRAYGLSLIRSHPDKPPTDELSQQKAKELTE